MEILHFDNLTQPYGRSKPYRAEDRKIGTTSEYVRTKLQCEHLLYS